MTLEDAKKLYPCAITYRPGENPTMNAEILRLVRLGRKTLTCGSWSHFEDGTEALPVVGRVDIALDWDGFPAYAAETLKVEKIRFCDMTGDRIAAHGEFQSQAEWVEAYRSYLTGLGLFSPEAPLMVETFRMVQDFGDNSNV